MDKNDKLVEILGNEQFKAESKTLTTAEDLQTLFAKYDLDLTMDEVYHLCASIACSMKSDDELDAEDLEYVAGGIAWPVVAAVALGVVCLGAFAIGVYNGYKSTRK